MAVPKPRVDPPKPSRAKRGTRATGATGTRSNRSTRSAAQDIPPQPEPEAQVPPVQEPPQPPRQSKPRAGSLEARLAEFLGICSFPFAAAGDQYSAQIVALRSPALATALADLAKENAAIKRVLERVLEGSAWGAVGLAAASIILPICQHHGMIPGSDPFAAILPSPAPPRPMAWSQGQPQQSPNGSTHGAPAPGSEGDPTVHEDGDDFTRVPGAPPGVVTVAATAAQHPGAR